MVSVLRRKKNGIGNSLEAFKTEDGINSLSSCSFSSRPFPTADEVHATTSWSTKGCAAKKDGNFTEQVIRLNCNDNHSVYLVGSKAGNVINYSSYALASDNLETVSECNLWCHNNDLHLRDCDPTPSVPGGADREAVSISYVWTGKGFELSKDPSLFVSDCTEAVPEAKKRFQAHYSHSDFASAIEAASGYLQFFRKIQSPEIKWIQNDLALAYLKAGKPEKCLHEVRQLTRSKTVAANVKLKQAVQFNNSACATKKKAD